MLSGPGQANSDVSFVKNTVLNERMRIHFRLDTFNLFNIPYFGFPDQNIGSPTAGKITGTLGDMRDLQFALKFEF